MPRTARASVASLCYHGINRGNARADVLRKPHDYATFRELLRAATVQVRMRVLTYSLMPTHFYLALYPLAGGDLSRF